jgi:transcriptional regulator with XRE-family HTH domain
MTIDGNKLRELRTQKGISQEKLGLLTNLNKRTIQRAEQGQPVALETLAFIADALQVDPKAIRARQLEMFELEAEPPKVERGEVVLVPVAKGSRLVNALRQAFHAKFEYQVEPTEENLPMLEELAGLFNAAWIDPWLPPERTDPGEADAEILRLQAKANRLLPALAEDGVTVYLASYDSWQQQPYYNFYEYEMSVDRNQAPEKVTNVVVVVSDESARHLMRAPADHEVFTEPKQQRRFTDDDLDDEIPF